MSVTDSIVSKLFENRRLNENWPPILDSINKYDKETIRKALLAKGYDIQNNPTELVKISNSRDPRLKKGFSVFVVKGKVLGVCLDGKILRDGWLDVFGKEFSKMSWKEVLSYDPDVYYMELDIELSQDMRDKRSSRAESQQGMLRRYDNRRKDGTYSNRVSIDTGGRWNRHVNVDKSGYEINPNKYVDMLATLQIPRASSILEQAKDIYVKLAGLLGSFDRDDREGSRKYYEYENLVRAIPNAFLDLDSALKEYNNYKKNTSDDERFSASWMEMLEDRVQSNIKELKSVIKRAQKFL